MKWDKLIVGVVIGLFCPIIILFGINVFKYPELGFIQFVKQSHFVGTMATWCKPAALFNFAPFTIAINSKKDRIARGIILATLVYGFYIVYKTFF